MHICQAVPQTYQCQWFTKRTEVIHDMPDSLQWIQDTPVWNTGYSNRLDSQRTKSCKPSTDTMVHSGHTRTSNSRTPIMCQTWHCGTQLCSQPPEEEVGAAEETHNRMWNSQKDLQDLKPPPLNTKEDLIKAYPDRFEGIGHFPGTYHITLRSSDAKPIVHAPQKCPIAMRPLVREKLDEFMEQGIIIPVEEPTDWVSSLAYSWKANGKLRVCLDPQDVNKAIKRDHYKTPTVEEITHLLAGSKKFTKVDGTSSYLCIVLDYESSLLTTFNTPWGRYRFICLPWGLSCAQDIFQQMMDQILEHCEGVIGIADDVIIHGKDDEDHDRNLHNFMHTACEHGLVFNREKCEVKKDSVTFFGTVYDANGAHPDPKKVDAIHKMPPPDNKQQLQHFLGMVIYLSPFMPSLSTHTAPLQ